MRSTAPGSWRLGHRPALDGIRGLAILIVLAGHAMPHALSFPAAGVALFFVLSGFLITSLLLEEYEQHGKVNVLGFYGRRARRLLPAFAVVGLVTFVAMVLIGQAREGLFDASIAASYVGNWVMSSGQWLGPLSQTWSLAIEEQFYALWPLILLLILPRLSRRSLILAVGLIAVAVMIGRATLFVGGASTDRLAFGSDVQADGLLIGCALALLIHYRPVTLPKATAPLALGVIIGAAFLLPVVLLLTTTTGTRPSLLVVLGTTLAVIAAGALVAALASSSSDPIFEHRWLTRIGLISYGLYLWHYPVFWFLGFFGDSGYPGVLAVVVGLSVSFALALASYRYVEQPFLNRRRKPGLANREARVEPLPSSALAEVTLVGEAGQYSNRLAGVIVRSLAVPRRQRRR